MYKPPENSNRVKAIKMRFESQEFNGNTTGNLNRKQVNGNTTKQTKNDSKQTKDDRKQTSDSTTQEREKGEGTSETETTTNGVLKPKIKCRYSETLNRQLSDPTKRNIKRTPAFRLDKNAFWERDHAFQRHHYGSVKSRLDKFRSIDDSRLKLGCDNDNFTDDVKSTVSKLKDFADEGNRITASSDDNLNISSSAIKTSGLNELITKMLYAEPVPKSQRKNNDELTDVIHKTKTLKLKEVKPKTKIETAENVIDILKNVETVNSGDTIKNALKRPLPAGPAPKKPPRTFQHSPQNSQNSDTKRTLPLEENFVKKLDATLKRNESRQKPPGSAKKDPKYMLEKLENALKNNKIKLQRQKNFDYSSDDDSLKTSKSTTASPLPKRLNDTNQANSQKFNFGCLNTMCSKPKYETIAESKSSFFVNKTEPIYAEPYQFDTVTRRNEEKDVETKDSPDGKQQRNSLYYMSSPVLGLQENEENGDKTEPTAEKEQVLLNNQSETSSFSSDTDSNASTPLEFANTNNAFVKDLIRSFEDKQGAGRKSNVTPRHRSRAKPADGNGSHRHGIVCDEKPHRTVRREESKFEIYVKTVRAFSVKKMSSKQLFHCCLLVGLDERCPYIKSKFPPNIEIPAYIEKLCFPDSEDHRINYSAKEQCYSLVVTDASGDRIYGYCRRVLPEGSCTCLPLAYCILTKHRAPRFYRRILQELESHHGLPDKQRDELLKEFYRLEFPRPGHSVRLDLSKIVRNEVKYYDTKGSYSTRDVENNNEVRKSDDDDLTTFCVLPHPCPHGILDLAGGRCSDNDGTKDGCPICSEVTYQDLVLTLHQDMRYEETDLKKLCETLHVSLLQKVFENLLLERKVIFISCHLSKLSSCIEAIQSVLYPFSWPHAFIPVLPKTRWEIVEAPAPLICGVLSISVVNEYKIENAIVVDLDSKEVLLEVEDDERILPDCAIKSWKKGLVAANSIVTSDNEHNVLLSDAFIRVFIQTCGHYRDFIKDNIFDREGFKTYPKSKGTRRFLQWFTQTTMFDLFIDAVLSNPDSFYVFDNRIKIYSSQDATLILEKMKDWKKL